jgi:hypothetical protein
MERSRRSPLLTACVLLCCAAYALAACDCHGNGVTEYEGTALCRCSCFTNVSKSDAGQTVIAQYVPPDCRVTTGQVQRMTLTVEQPLRDFLFPSFAAALVTNLGMDATTSEVYRLRMNNISSTKFELVLEFRCNGPDRNGLQAAKFARNTLEEAVASQAAWAAALRITAVEVKTVTGASANSDPPIAATIGDTPIAWETIIALVALVVIPFALLFVDLIATSNFITSDEEGQKVLDEYLKEQYAPSASQSPSPAPREAWLSGTEEDRSETEAPDGDSPKPLRRAGTRTLEDYSAKFYANAGQMESP